VITQLQVVLGESNRVIGNEDLFAIKFGSPLFSKLKMEYWRPGQRSTGRLGNTSALFLSDKLDYVE
jgi:hypothetical protein